MILGGVFGPEKAKELLESVMADEPPVAIVTPYLKHYLLEALIYAGMKDKALEIIEEYWGGMVRLGADTF